MNNSDSAQSTEHHYCLLRYYLEASYMDIEGDNQSVWDKEKIFGKIDMLATALTSGQRHPPELMFDIVTFDERSKLVTLLFGLKYRLMKSVMRRLADGLRPMETVGTPVLMNWIAALSAMRSQAFALVPLVVQ